MCQVSPSSIDYSVLRGWILHCQNHHSSVCLPLWNEEDHKEPALRVIDCETRTVIDVPEDYEFAALSYAWGTLNQEDKGVSSASAKGSLPETLPLTVSDAMRVVLELHLKYLWVDKYCIDQSNLTKLQSQISIMDLIYDRAVVTIIAGCGDDRPSAFRASALDSAFPNQHLILTVVSGYQGCTTPSTPSRTRGGSRELGPTKKVSSPGVASSSQRSRSISSATTTACRSPSPTTYTSSSTSANFPIRALSWRLRLQRPRAR